MKEQSGTVGLLKNPWSGDACVAVIDDSADGCGQPRPRSPSAGSPGIVHFLLVQRCVFSRRELRSEPGPPRRINPVDARPRGASERHVHAASTGPTRAGSPQPQARIDEDK